MPFDLTNFKVGDEFEKSQNELGQIISAILAEGGTFKYEGKSVVITSLPNRLAEPVVAPTPDPVVEPVAESVTESVTESVPTEPIVEHEVKSELVETPMVAEKPKPKAAVKSPVKKIQ